MWYVARGRRALFEQALPGQLTDRVERALAIYLRESDERPADLLQKPSFLYVPDLGARRFLDNSLFPDLEKWTSCLSGVGHEIDACLTAQPKSNPFSLQALTDTVHAGQPESADRRIAVYRRGVLGDTARKYAPGLVSALDGLPLVRIPQHGPDVEILALQAGARSPLSHGRTNSRVSVVMALESSPAMEITVGGESRELRAREAIVFDSTFGFQYDSRGGTAKALWIEIWHPDLSSAERESIAALTSAAVDFDTRLQDLR
jgi:aspartate beta-hydroxylase